MNENDPVSGIRDLLKDYDMGWRPFRCTSTDGLQLSGRDYGDPNGRAMPIVCLPGLTRNGKDFHAIASALSRGDKEPRRILTLDFRGRGQSDYDPDWSHYAPAVELGDVQTAMSAAGIKRAFILATSRGGLVAMLLAATAPDAVAGLILNDVGPELEADGLARIRGYVVSPERPQNWRHAVDLVKMVNAEQFPRLSDQDWCRFAVQIYRDDHGSPALDFDPALGKTLELIDFTQPLPNLWDVFDGLAAVPLLVLRGANSDILTQSKMAEMARRHGDMRSLSVPDQGHAPLLWDSVTGRRIAEFIAVTGKQSAAE